MAEGRVPDDLRVACWSCSGKGTEADYVGLEMRCVESECSQCGGRGWVLPSQEDLIERIGTAEGLLAEANATIARLSPPVEDSELIAAMKSAPVLGDRFSLRFNRIISSRISGGAK